MSTQEYIRTITDTFPDEFPTLTPLNEMNTGSTEGSSSFLEYISNVSWQTWVIIILILALLGINIFAYLAKGTQATASFFDSYIAPILSSFGYTTLETTKETVKNTATGTKAGVDIVSDTSIGAIDTVEQTQMNENIPQGQNANTSHQGSQILNQTTKNTSQQDSLENALNNASQIMNVNEEQNGPKPYDSVQTSGKAGWCFIGEDQGVRTCSDIGVNDTCMSGDVFPSQEICMNPKLRV